jgi:hypothetical protein
MSEDSPQTTAPQPSSQWQYNPQDDQKPAPAPVGAPQPALQQQYDPPVTSQAVEDEDDPMPPVTWSAAEFIAHHKDIRWYLSVIGITIVLAAIVRLLTGDNISTVMLVIIGVFFCLTAARKPRTLNYSLNEDGILIGERFMPYSDFRSFSVIHDGQLANIELVPMKRFMPLVSIYCSAEAEDDAIDTLADFLPYEERTHSVVDRFARRIRF